MLIRYYITTTVANNTLFQSHVLCRMRALEMKL